MSGSVSATTLVVPVDDVHVVALDGEKVLFTPGTGALHHLDRAAALVWDCLLPPAPLGEIVDDLSAAFAADRKVVLADVTGLLQALLRDGAVRAADVEDLQRDT